MASGAEWVREQFASARGGEDARVLVSGERADVELVPLVLRDAVERIGLLFRAGALPSPAGEGHLDGVRVAHAIRADAAASDEEIETWIAAATRFALGSGGGEWVRERRRTELDRAALAAGPEVRHEFAPGVPNLFPPVYASDASSYALGERLLLARGPGAEPVRRALERGFRILIAADHARDHLVADALGGGFVQFRMRPSGVVHAESQSRAFKEANGRAVSDEHEGWASALGWGHVEAMANEWTLADGGHRLSPTLLAGWALDTLVALHGLEPGGSVEVRFTDWICGGECRLAATLGEPLPDPFLADVAARLGRKPSV